MDSIDIEVGKEPQQKGIISRVWRSIFYKEIESPKVLVDFANDTSAGGIPFIITKPTIFLRLLWTVLVIVAFLLFCIEAFRLSSAYYDYHTNVELISSESVAFPSVTICNFNKMKRTEMSKNERFKSVLEFDDFWQDGVNPNDYSWLWEDYVDSPSSKNPTQVPNRNKRNDQDEDDIFNDISFWFPSSSHWFPPNEYWYYNYWSEPPDNFEDYLDGLGENFLKSIQYLNPTLEELQTLGHKKEDFIRQCRFNGKNCSYRDFKTFQNSKYGNCFSFYPQKDKLAGGQVTKVGEQHGLHLTLFIESPEYVGLFGEESGVRLAIHQRNVLPHPEDIGISLSPGFSTSIGVLLVELRRLPEPHGNCTDGKNYDHLSRKRYNYTVISCQKKCLQTTLKDTCGCVTNVYEDFKNESQCNRSKPIVRCRQQVEKEFYNNSLKCTNCPAPCREFIYNTRSSHAVWPSDMYHYEYKQRLNNSTNANLMDQKLWENITTTRKNLVRVKIYFEELNFQLIKQIPSNTPTSFLSDIGGILGLFLGFSLITVFEVCLLVIDIIKIAMKKVVRILERVK